MASNLLKMYVDVELFLVTLVGLVLRIDSTDLSTDPLSTGLLSLFPDSCGWLCTGTLYGDLLWILLMLTLVPIIVSVMYRSPEEKAQALLHKIARVDLDDETSELARRRKQLVEAGRKARRKFGRRQQDTAEPRAPQLARTSEGFENPLSDSAAAAQPPPHTAAAAGRATRTRRGEGLASRSRSGQATPLNVDALFRVLGGARGSVSFEDFAQWWTQREREAGLEPDEDSIELSRQLFEAHGGNRVNRAELRGVLLHVMQIEWVEAGEDRGHVYYANPRTGESLWEKPNGRALDAWLEQRFAPPAPPPTSDEFENPLAGGGAAGLDDHMYEVEEAAGVGDTGRLRSRDRRRTGRHGGRGGSGVGMSRLRASSTTHEPTIDRNVQPSIEQVR